MVKVSNNGLLSSNIIDWYVFGKFIVNLKMLKSQSILLFKYASYAPIPWLKRMVVSDKFKIFWIDLIAKRSIDYELLKECSSDDIKLFEKIILKACLYDDLKYKPVQSNESEVVEKFEVLRGEIMSGNNNPNIISEIKIVIDKLIDYGKIQPDDKNEIIEGLENYINENKI